MSVVLDGWAVTVKPGETFAKETPVKMVEFALTKKDHIIVLANQVTSVPTVSSLELLVTVLPVAMVALV